MEKKDFEEDAAERALELTCRWLHAHKMALDEKVTADGLYAGMSLYSPEEKTMFEGEDFPKWDWAGRRFPKKDAVLSVVKWLFREDGDECGYGPPAVVEEVSRNVSPGRYRTEILTKPVPKFSFSSLEEFVLKAETSGDMRAEDSFDSDVRSGRRR